MENFLIGFLAVVIWVGLGLLGSKIALIYIASALAKRYPTVYQREYYLNNPFALAMSLLGPINFIAALLFVLIDNKLNK